MTATFSRDHAALLRAILVDPADDLPRLAYADWCEENGQEDRGEFIRVQVELAKMDEDGWGYDEEYGHTCHEDPCPVCDSVDRHEHLARRERELLTGHRHYVWSSLPSDVMLASGYWTFARGFASAITLGLADFLTHAATLGASQPITSVTLSDVEVTTSLDPLPDRGPYSIIFPILPVSDSSPWPAWTKLRNLVPLWHIDEASARAALSAGCVAYLRQEAGLPPLPG